MSLLCGDARGSKVEMWKSGGLKFALDGCRVVGRVRR